MNMSIRNQSLLVQPVRVGQQTLRSRCSLSRAINVAKRRREQVLAALAFVMLVVAWDATLRMDEQVSPPRMRLSHAVEREVEMQPQVLMP
jgi:hypothetical protein